MSPPPTPGKLSKSQLVFCFTSDWLRKWRNVFLADHKAYSIGKLKQLRNYFQHSIENSSKCDHNAISLHNIDLGVSLWMRFSNVTVR